jgi:hypothetical protein
MELTAPQLTRLIAYLHAHPHLIVLMFERVYGKPLQES